jgi:hypothetical protein
MAVHAQPLTARRVASLAVRTTIAFGAAVGAVVTWQAWRPPPPISLHGFESLSLARCDGIWRRDLVAPARWHELGWR